MSVRQFLETAFEAVVDSAEKDPTLARRLVESLGAQVVEVEKARTPSGPPFNPIACLKRDGEDALREALKPYNGSQMRKILEFHGLDPAKETLGQSAAKMKDFAVAAAKSRVASDQRLRSAFDDTMI